MWCLPLSAVAPIEDGYFLQVDSGGSKPNLMPPPNKWVIQGECMVNAGVFNPSAIRAFGSVWAVQPLMVGVGQLQAPKFGALTNCPTINSNFSCKGGIINTRLRAHGAYALPLRSCVCA